MVSMLATKVPSNISQDSVIPLELATPELVWKRNRICFFTRADSFKNRLEQKKQRDLVANQIYKVERLRALQLPSVQLYLNSVRHCGLYKALANNGHQDFQALTRRLRPSAGEYLAGHDTKLLNDFSQTLPTAYSVTDQHDRESKMEVEIKIFKKWARFDLNRIKFTLRMF